MEQIFGIILHSIGGFSSASFYVPSHLVKKWAWQTYWITLGFVAWIVMPTVGGLLTTPDIMGILRSSPRNSLIWTYVFGVLWGFGGSGCRAGAAISWAVFRSIHFSWCLRYCWNTCSSYYGQKNLYACVHCSRGNYLVGIYIMSGWYSILWICRCIKGQNAD